MSLGRRKNRAGVLAVCVLGAACADAPVEPTLPADVAPSFSQMPASTYYYVDWTSGNMAAGKVSGVITLPTGPINVEFKVLNPNGTPGTFYGYFTGPGQIFGPLAGWGNNNYWSPSTPYVGAVVANPPTPYDLIALTGGTKSSYIVTFSAPVQDPVMDILSLGNGGTPTTYDFDRTFDIVSTGRGFWGGGVAGDFVIQPGEQLVGREGHGAIRFVGSLATVSWSVPSPETWHAFTIAVRGLGDPNADSDGDGVRDGADNCPTVANPSQADSDFDGVGDACDAVNDGDADSDGDGLTNAQERALGTSPTNPDTDGDGVNDRLDAYPLDPTRWRPDADGDGVNDSVDNCPAVANADQANFDGDAQGDACDPDDDNDGVADTSDAFPKNANESVDTDGDGIGNNADTDDDNDGLSDVAEAAAGTNPLKADTDGDGVKDGQDAFPLDPRESRDSDGDGVGDNADAFDNSTRAPTVVIGTCNSGVRNHHFGNGTWFSDLISAAQASATNHGKFVSAVADLADGWKKAGLISGAEQGAIVSCAARSK